MGDGQILQKDIDAQLLDKLLNWLKACDSLWLHGLGESLLRDDFGDLLKKIPPWIGTGLVTNGTLLTEEKARILVKHLLDHLRISIDGATPETYAKIRGQDQLSRILDNLRRLRKIKEELGSDRPVVDLCFVAMRENFRELPQLVQLAAKEKIPIITIQRLTAYRESDREQSLWWEKNEFNTALHEAKQLAKELGVVLGGHEGFSHASLQSDVLQSPEPIKSWGDCHEPWDFMFVMNTGEVNGCTYPAPLLGDLNRENPEEIWNGPRFRSWRQTVNANNRNDFCRHCPHPNNQCADHSYQMFVPLNKMKQWGYWEPGVNGQPRNWLTRWV